MKHDLPVSFLEACDHCSLLGVSLKEESYLKIGKFLDLLVKGSNKTNLIGPAEVERLWIRHVLESVVFIPFLHSRVVFDVGTGAGFPGMVLAMCGFDVTMIESRRKRCAFLETVARSSGVSCRIINSRVEEAGPFPAGSLFTSRAVKKPSEMVKLIVPAVPGGFTLVTRVSELEVTRPNTSVSSELPVPPLDRRGFILQYRHPCIKN